MEGDAGTSRLNPTPDADETPDGSLAVSTAESIDDQEERRAPRLGRGWATGIVATLLMLAVGLGVGGYLAWNSHAESEEIARNEAAALEAATDCVSATQAPDTAAMARSQAKIIECSTGDFHTQAMMYSGVLVDAYQAADVTVKVSDLRAAVERRNDDGSMDVLVAMRVQVTNSEVADQEQGYRLRVQMAPDDGAYRIARLDQVTS